MKSKVQLDEQLAPLSFVERCYKGQQHKVRRLASRTFANETRTRRYILGNKIDMALCPKESSINFRPTDAHYVTLLPV